MTELILVRHGHTTYNDGRFTGQTDAPLDALGEEQVICTGEYILSNYKIDAICSSDLSRAIRTAQPVADALSLPIETYPGLREVDVGVWAGKTFEEIEEKYSEDLARFRARRGVYQFEGGETYAILQKRALGSIVEIAQKYDGKCVLVTCHGGTLRTLLCAFTGVPVENMDEVSHFGNASVSEVFYEDGVFRVGKVNEKEHLKHLKKGNAAS